MIIIEIPKGVNVIIYKFIFNQIIRSNHLPSTFNNIKTVNILKEIAEKHYGLSEYNIEEWEFAFEWALANVFGDGVECETL